MAQGVTLLGGVAVGGGVALLEELCHGEWALNFQMLKPGPMSLSQELANSVVELLAISSTLCLPVFHHASQYDDNRL